MRENTETHASCGKNTPSTLSISIASHGRAHVNKLLNARPVRYVRRGSDVPAYASPPWLFFAESRSSHFVHGLMVLSPAARADSPASSMVHSPYSLRPGVAYVRSRARCSRTDATRSSASWGQDVSPARFS
ncbi:hypothetical protein FA95DRAFT_1187420 [Auriscalpium vulgare]|uniref:Uncharacterized protein n=1 Tax=Auriscalpium vulgare TaxID=40419 RepID=A0ACB8R3K7_9AGAM|nr:hypothetical protein FA95DRAFT_1187420 [Auriscalpium vulgare]